MEENIYISYPKQHKFKNIDEVYYYVDQMDYRTTQGIIIFTPNNTQYKIYNKTYYDFYKVRGNESSIKFRYLQIRMDKTSNDMLHYLYPEFSKSFDEYEDNIYEIGKNIYGAYIDRFIKKQYVTVPVEEFNVIKECHTWHVEDRLNNRINLNKVLDILNRQTPTNINKMIRHLKIDKKNGFVENADQEVKKKPFVKNLKQNQKRIPLLKK
jgi:hypothetical protein